ncbi:MAG: DUF4198 domain-containing protein [Alphaproteobacteria bacterium]|nr:DUF4198 domain-containing protein [Alphaproteobacteria bacterium]
MNPPAKETAMRFPLMAAVLAVALALPIVTLPIGAVAHRAWLLPSATVLSGADQWVTVDAAVSNDLFFFEHNPLRLDGLSVTAPDGSPAAAENTATGRYRSTFDVKIARPGTWKIAVVTDGLFASWREDGQPRRWRGTAEALAREVPENAENLRVTQSQGRLEAFVTAGKPTDGVLQPTGKGLELMPITHPNDLVAGTPASFRFLLDGAPRAGLEVTIIRGGIRYRDNLGALTATTDAEGAVSVTWPEPGMYWIEASVRDDRTATARAKERRASYAATLEVLP